jgi:amino acid adenylation domain-containing protein
MAEPINNRMAALTPHQIRCLVEKLRKTAGTSEFDRFAGERSSGENFPLSSAQERLWFLYKLAPDSSAYNNPVAVRLSTPAPLDFGIFTRAVAEVVRRHEILRATFSMTDVGPVQTIAPKSQAGVLFEDLSPLVAGDQERRVAEIAVCEASLPFDLDSGPLLRVKILHLGGGEYVLLVTSHHIVMDGWSNGIFSKELAMIYSAFANGRPSLLPESRFQYLDYVNWERNTLQGERLMALLNFWRGELGRVDQSLVLPTDYPRPRGLASSGRLTTRLIGRDLAERLRALSRNHGGTLYQTLIAAFFVLLYRWTGQTHLRVGTPVANRTVKRFEDVIGLFVNTIVVSADIRGRPSFCEFLARVRHACERALAHQELPFEKLVGSLETTRDLGTHPIFQVFFVYQNFPGVYSFPGVTVRPVKFDYGTAKFDLNLWVEDLDESLLLSLNFRTDLFETTTASGLLERFEALLEDVASGPDKSVSELGSASVQSTPMLERCVAPLAGADDCLQLRFERVAEANPTNVAVECGDEFITYGDLNRRANQLARYLVSRGFVARSRVAILLNRSVDLIVAILAVMKAGAAYVPLDSSFPAAQLGFMVADAEAALVITECSLRATAINLPAPMLVLDKASDELAAFPNSDLNHHQSSQDLAYVIYTSGTSGRPKGVCIEHRNLLAYIDSIEPILGLSKAARLASVSSIAADLGNTMIFGALGTGRCLVIILDEVARDAAKFRDHLCAHPVDCLKIVPSHLEALLCIPNPECGLPSRLLVLGGEALTWDLVGRIEVLAPGCRILNHYGPTEATIGTATYLVPPNDRLAPRGAFVPIGFPLGDAVVSIRSPEGDLVNEGSEGELFIGGPTVGRGYWRRPLLDSQRFVTESVPGRDCARLFKTGDRVRRLPSGELEFLGRLDRQAKVRGYRIELPEVELALLACPGVRQAVCFVPPADRFLPGLQAAVVLQRPNSRTPEELMTFLRERLPPFMVPTRFEIRDAIPVTVNGKIDFAELSAPVMKTQVSSPTAPRDDLEARLLEIWREVLGDSTVGVHDDFFAAGGHSLAVMRLTGKIQSALKRQVPVALLFERRTVAQLATFLRANTIATKPLVVIQSGGTASPIVLVHPAGGTVLCYYEISKELGANVPVFGLQAFPGPVDCDSIESLAMKYVSAIATLDPGDVILAGWSMGGTVAFEMARLLESRGSRPRWVGILDQPAPNLGARVKRHGQRDTDIDDFISKVERYLGVPVGSLSNDCAPEPFEAKTAAIQRALVGAGILNREMNASDFRQFLALQRKHTEAAAAYAPGLYGGEICVFRAAGSDVLTEDCGPALGWAQYATGRVMVQVTPGNHFTMMRPPAVSKLAARIRRLAFRQQNASTAPEEFK